MLEIFDPKIHGEPYHKYPTLKELIKENNHV